MTLDAALGLRERKRLATRRAIQIVALDLVQQRGLDKVTVDDISREVDISPRTFFNYFATKEEAILGDGPLTPSDEHVAEFLATGPGVSVMSALGELLASTAAASPIDVELVHARKRLLKDYPELFAKRIATMHSFQAEMRKIVLRKLEVDQPLADKHELEERAGLTVMVSEGVMRHAWTCWADDGSASDLAERLRSTFARLPGLLN